MIEFVADKVPYVDSTWDVIHTFIRVPAGAVLAASAFGDFDRSIQVSRFAGRRSCTQLSRTKAATRAMLNASPEPVSNWVASIAEDIVAVVSVVVSVFVPVLIFVIVGAGLVISFLVFRRILRFFRQVARSIRGWFAPATHEAATKRHKHR